MKKLLLKKTKGDSTYVATLIAIFVIVILFMALFYSFAQIQQQNKVVRVYRQYLMEMETQGYLTPGAKTRLTAELTALGVSNLDFTGTSLAPVGYGQPVTIHIQGDLAVSQLNFATSTPRKNGGTIHIDMEYSGTALY